MLAPFLMLLAVHWVADFMLQTHWQAQNKSKNNLALVRHVGTYSVALSLSMPFIFAPDLLRWAVFISSNAILHFGTDYLTSRASARLYAKQDWHNFFVVIGLDQLIHQLTLAGTMLLMFGSAA